MRKLLLCALLACAGAIMAVSDANAAGNIYSYTCTNTTQSNSGVTGELQLRLNGLLAWTHTNFSSGTKAAVASGDTVNINSSGGGTPCLGDVYVTTSGITFTNASGATGSGCSGSTDTTNGMFEIAGATNVTVACLVLHCTACSQNAVSSTGLSSQTENAALVLHSGADVLLENGNAELSATSGIWLDRSAISVLRETVDLNGTGSTGIAYTAGIYATHGSTVRLGDPNGTAAPDIVVNGSVSKCPDYGIVLEKNSNLEAYAASIGASGGENGCGELYLDAGSSATLQTAFVEHPTVAGTAITLLGGSSIVMEPNPFGLTGASTVTSGSGGALLITGASSVRLNSASISSTGSTVPTIEASGSSNLVLAGGNNICAGSLSGSNCTPTAGATAIEVDHSSSLQHLLATQLGYAASTTAENVTGKGTVLMQSSADLGQGQVSGGYGLIWSGALSVGQNSAIRMESGVHVTGAVQISAASNGYFNCNNNGNSCSGAGAANEIDGTVQCLELLATPANPSVHVSNPQLIVNSSLAADSGVAVANLFGASSFATSAPAANTCLNF